MRIGASPWAARTRRGGRWIGAVVALGLGAWPQPGRAQPAPDAQAGRIAFTPDFFADIRPLSAFDMVNRLPGFTFSRGDEVRGFGGAAGNVLIDGERPSSKSVPLDQVLQRIPPTAVARIELIRGGAPGIDMQGQPVVANVVRKAGASSTKAVQLLLKPYPDGYVGVIPRFEGTWRSGPLSLEGQVMGRKDYHTDSGEGELKRRRSSGALFEAGPFLSVVETRNVQANGAAGLDLGAAAARLNLSAERNDTDRREQAELAGAGTAFVERSHSLLRNDKAELGGDLKRDFGGRMSSQLIGLHTRKRDTLKSRSDGRGPEQIARERGDTTETIGRATVTVPDVYGLRLETGGETALNALTSRSSLSRGGQAVSVPFANIRVQEQRGEVFATATGRLHPRLSFEAGSRFEISAIRQTGIAAAQKTLSFAKPRLILALSPFTGAQLRLRVERTVGQLNFKDFAATTELEAGAVNAGNPDIEPERAWLFEAALERRFWGRGAAVLTLSHAQVEAVVDLIPLGGRFDAPGNIGDGTRDEARLSLQTPLDQLGVTGGLLVVNATWRWSAVVDPVTGISRRISGQRPLEGSVVVSKSMPRWRSTVALDTTLGYNETFYRINEIRRNQEQPMLKLYWDWAARPDLIFRFQLENFTAKERKRFRTLFDGPRSDNLVAYREERNAEQAPFLMFRVRKTL